jgi:hypothetical protein
MANDFNRRRVVLESPPCAVRGSLTVSDPAN